MAGEVVGSEVRSTKGDSMARTTKRGAIGVVRAIGVGVVALVSSLALAGMPVAAQEAPTFDIWDFGVVPRPSLQSVLLSMDAVQQELKITDAQKKEQAAIEGRQSSRIQQARRENKDRTSSWPLAKPSSMRSRRRSRRP